MLTIQKGTYNLPPGIQKEFMDNLIGQMSLLKADYTRAEIDTLNERITTIEKNMELWGKKTSPILFPLDEKQKKTKVKIEINQPNKDSLQDCKKIISRTLEILSDWSGIQDIRLQIQYAAVVTGKIDNIKKTDYIQSNDTRKKICTLLKSVIRINVTDIVFSEEQISLLKKGFLLLLTEQIQKTDMLQLNRDFIAHQLPTMPAWE